MNGINMADRRQESMMNKLLNALPAVAVAVFSAYVGFVVLLNTQSTRLEFVEEDLDEIKGILTTLSETSVEIARQGEWMRGQERRMQTIENAILILKEQTQDRYTRTEAQKDLQLLRQEIMRRHEEHGG